MKIREPIYLDDCTALRETGKAVLVEYEGHEAWVPKSQIHDDSEVFECGHEGTLVIPEWLATEKGWAE